MRSTVGEAPPLPQVLFLGGNGHATARLGLARRALDDLPPEKRFTLEEAVYPGFEGRPRSAYFDGFLAALTPLPGPPPALVYATGIGGLLALCLRSRGGLAQVPIVLQAPILWGLKTRAFPRMMRAAPFAPRLLGRAFQVQAVQERFLKRYFLQPPSAEMRALFFDGYVRCSAFGDLFRWLSPRLLGELEAAFKSRPEALDKIVVWWGGQDRVVSVEELCLTETALGRVLPLQTFPDWGHYPMMDDPDGWVATVADALKERHSNG